jgi:hypothetical protein
MDLATYEAETAFADLICADPEWLRDEFDALVSASFGQPPAPPPPAPPQVPQDDGDRHPPSRPQPGPVPGAVTSARAAPGRRRQRSPPPDRRARAASTVRPGS